MDLIDRQAAISDFEWCKSQSIDKDKWQEAIDRIKALPAADTDISAYSDKLWRLAYEGGRAEVQRWIPVTERLPDDDSWAIWCSKNGVQQIARLKTDAIDHFFPSQGFFNLDDAVAWQPLPEPYKDGN